MTVINTQGARASQNLQRDYYFFQQKSIINYPNEKLKTGDKVLKWKVSLFCPREEFSPSRCSLF